MFGKINQKRNIIIAALAIRLLLAPFAGHPADMKYWEYFGKALLVEHVNPYTNFVYPPPWILIIGVMYNVYLVFPNQFFLYFVLKLPIIMGDIIMGLALYDIVKELSSSKKKANYALALFLLNPYTIWISSVWGMFDVLPALCTLLSLRFYLKGDKKVSFLFLGLGAAFKYYPILLLPVLLILEWRNNQKFGSLLKDVFYTGLPFVVTSLPFIILNWESYFHMITQSPLMLHELWSIPASYMSFLYVLQDISPELFSQLTNDFLWSNILSYTIFLVLYVLIMIHLYKRESGSQSKFLNEGFLMVILAILFSSKMVNEQYLQWAIPFMIIDFLIFKDNNQKFFITLWGAFFAFFSINVPVYNFIPDVYSKTYEYTAFLAPFVDFYENQIPRICKSTALFVLGLTISVTFVLYLRNLLKRDQVKQ